MAKAESHKLKNGTWRCKANYTDEAGKYRQKSFTGMRDNMVACMLLNAYKEQGQEISMMRTIPRAS